MERTDSSSEDRVSHNWQAIRAEQIDRMENEPLDLLVIGGGMRGGGIARDAAMRGLRVALVEQGDFASGTSSRSSRLLHGGLRYLAQGRLRLVREASREKHVLHRIAPHLCDPLAFVFPTYRGAPWPLWQLRIGVKLYDLLCGGRNLGPSSALGPERLLEHLPGLRSEGLTGAVRYFDALTNDARLVIDTLRSASRAGAVVQNYTRAVSAHYDNGLWQCELVDLLSDRNFRTKARAVAHAAGPWAERLPQNSIRLRLTKGVHLVIDRQRLPVPDAVVMSEQKRILFAIPWGERVILGTTDTEYDGPIEQLHTEPGDVAYVLRVVNEHFPSAKLADDDVIGTWAGLRPLIYTGRGGPSDISRAHRIRMPHPGWFDVAGGKLTTYRLIGRQVVDQVARHLQLHTPASPTAEEPLLPNYRDDDPSGILPPPVEQSVVEHFCRREWAVHLDDVMLRRSSWHHYRTDRARLARQVAHWMAEILAWDEPTKQNELERYDHLPP